MVPPIDVDNMVDFMVGLLNTPSPTGDTSRGVHYVQDAFAHLPFKTEITPKGLLVGTWPGESSEAPRGVTAHVDTLGAMVREIKDDGRLRITQLGGWRWSSVEGEGLTIFATNGETFRGSFVPTTASVHAHTRPEQNAARDDTNMEVRIDAFTKSKAETEALGICVGDVIAFDPRVEVNDNGYIRSRHLDDKASIACIYGALQAIHQAGLTPKQTTTIHISNYEEVGHGGATGFPADMVDLLTVDMAVVAPKQQSDEHSVTICAKDAAGPYHMEMRRELEALAAKNQITYKTDIYPYYGSDGESYWRAGADVRVALIGPGVDASHHYERTHRDALEQSAKLILAYLLS